MNRLLQSVQGLELIEPTSELRKLLLDFRLARKNWVPQVDPNRVGHAGGLVYGPVDGHDSAGGTVLCADRDIAPQQPGHPLGLAYRAIDWAG